MIYPDSRYRFSQGRGNRRKARGRLLGAVLIVAVLGAGGYFILRNGLPFTRSQKQAAPARVDLASLWNSQRYTELIKAADDELNNNPMDGTALVFDGFSSFYAGITQVALDDKLQYIEKSISALRRALLLAHPPYVAQIHYVLGKAYYQKGQYFTDLAIKHLKIALDMGYKPDDIYEYLGLSYNRLGLFKDGVDWFLKAVRQNPTKDVLYLTIAQTYFQMGDSGQATQYVDRAISASSDDFLVQKAMFLLGDIYRKEGNLAAAEREYQKIVSSNPQSSDGHFYLGETYSAMGDRARARAEWREALRIDPNNEAAYNRLRGK